MKTYRYSGKRHNADLAAWLKRRLFGRIPPVLGVIDAGGRVAWTFTGRPRKQIAPARRELA